MELFRAWLFYMPNIFGYHQRPAAFPKKKFEIYYFWREQLEKSCEIRGVGRKEGRGAKTLFDIWGKAEAAAFPGSDGWPRGMCKKCWPQKHLF